MNKNKKLTVVIFVAVALIVAGLVVFAIAKTVSDRNTPQPTTDARYEPDPQIGDNDLNEDEPVAGNRINDFTENFDTSKNKVVHLEYVMNIDGKDVDVNEYYDGKATFTSYTSGKAKHNILKNSDGVYEFDASANTYKKSDSEPYCLIKKFTDAANSDFAVYEVDTKKIDGTYYTYDGAKTNKGNIAVYLDVTNDNIMLLGFDDDLFKFIGRDDKQGDAVLSLDGYKAE